MDELLLPEKLARLSQAFTNAKNDPLEQIILLVEIGKSLSSNSFHRGAQHAFETAKKISIQINHSHHHMNATAASLLEKISLREDIDQGHVSELFESCKRNSSSNGAWTLTVVASKFYLAQRYQSSFDLFSRALILDSQSPQKGAASKIAFTYSGDILCNNSGAGPNEKWTKYERWKQAEQYYHNALEIDSNFVDAKTSLAELLRQRGDFSAAIAEYESIYECLHFDIKKSISSDTAITQPPLDLIFNHAQCLESMNRLEECFILLVHHAELAIQSLPPNGDSELLAEHALVLYYIKVRYIVGQLDVQITAELLENIQHILHETPMSITCSHLKFYLTSLPNLTPWNYLLHQVVGNWSLNVEKTIRSKLSTHWAYAFYIRQLSKSNSCHTHVDTSIYSNSVDLAKMAAWIPIIGDSHSLSFAWSKVQGKTVLPFVATGLKAWHMRPNCQFVTNSNLNCIFEKLGHLFNGKSNGKSKKDPQPLCDCLFSVGEIDCRNDQGILYCVEQGKYSTIESAIQTTVEILLSALLVKSEEYGVHFHLLSVPPPSDNNHTQRARVVTKFNEELRSLTLGNKRITFVDIEKASSTKDGFLKAELQADGTHLNRNVVNLVNNYFTTTM